MLGKAWATMNSQTSDPANRRSVAWVRYYEGERLLAERQTSSQPGIGMSASARRFLRPIDVRELCLLPLRRYRVPHAIELSRRC